MSWRDFLTDQERQRLDAIPLERAALTLEYRTIYNRARKRMERERENGGEKQLRDVLATALAKDKITEMRDSERTTHD